MVAQDGVIPVNHILAIKSQLVHDHAWLAGEIMSLFTRARSAAGVSDEQHPYGLEPNRRSMQMLLDFAADQKLTERPYRVDELFYPL